MHVILKVAVFPGALSDISFPEVKVWENTKAKLSKTAKPSHLKF